MRNSGKKHRSPNGYEKKSGGCKHRKTLEQIRNLLLEADEEANEAILSRTVMLHVERSSRIFRGIGE